MAGARLPASRGCTTNSNQRRFYFSAIGERLRRPVAYYRWAASLLSSVLPFYELLLLKSTVGARFIRARLLSLALSNHVYLSVAEQGKLI